MGLTNDHSHISNTRQYVPTQRHGSLYCMYMCIYMYILTRVDMSGVVKEECVVDQYVFRSHCVFVN